MAHLRTLLAVFCLLPALAAAERAPQSLFRARSITATATGAAVQLDTLSLVPGSLALRDAQGRLVPDSLYEVDYARATLAGLPRGGALSGALSATYCVLPFLLTKPVFSKAPEQFLSGDTILSEGNPLFAPRAYPRQREGVLASSGLEHSGSLMRGLNVSTSSSTSLTSELSLQLSGKLTDELSMVAAISDKSLPVSAEGNTASLQEFDKVFVSVFTKQSTLSAGDVELREEQDFFGKHSRKALGAAFSTRQKKGDALYTVSASAGVGKGKFARSTLAVVNGSQGPYQLSGAEGERSIVVLSGSERVYADGRLLERGSDADYTISYATAELTFMPRFVVTHDVHLTVEFEYSEQSYTRYVAGLHNALRLRRGSLYLNAFYEGDVRSQPLDNDLTDAEVQQLAAAGAQHWRAVAPAVDSVAWSASEILYRKKDTVSNGAPLTVYEYSADPAVACYRLRFSEVAGGSYKLASSSANGRVYAWVGAGSGSFEPVRRLVAPKRQLLLTVGGAFRADSGSGLALNAAMSSSSANLFAAAPDAAKTGFGLSVAGETGWELPHQNRLKLSSSALLFGKSFATPERFVGSEFEDDWNIDGELLGRDFRQLAVGLGYRHADRFGAGTTFTALSVGSTDAALSPLDTSYSAMLGGLLQADVWLRYRRFASFANGSFLRTSQRDRTSQQLRAKAEVAQGFWALTAGLRGELERNLILVDHVLVSRANYSAAFYLAEFFLRTDSAKHSAGLFTRYRMDFSPQGSVLQAHMQTREVGLTGEQNGKTVRNKLTVTYRNIRYAADTAAPENMLLGREELSGTFANGFVSASTLYELGAGMEPKQDFIYVEVGTAQGIYAWHDYNGNGVKELNEFEVAAFRDEALYIRVALPSREYVQAYTGKFAFQLSLLPAMIIGKQSGLLGFLSRLSNTFSFSNAHKNLRSSFASNANPFFSEPLGDTAVLSQSSAVVNTLSYLSPSARTKVELGWQSNRAKSLLVNGFEIRQNNLVSLNAEQRLTSVVMLRAGVQREAKDYGAQYAQVGAGYALLQHVLGGACELTPLMHLRVSASYKLSMKENRTGGELADLHDAQLEGTYNFPQKGVLTGSVGFVSTAFAGESGGIVGYEMLQGYGAGRNFTWGTAFKRLLGKGFELNLLYAGRKLPVGKVVHSGSVEVRMVF
ncbi:MAG: hypothetical protein LBS63_05720 [Prevotellaceae bacterium]|jgi:hypothetical protein|nr:hypothetical protein [Prevotellaceae bacterium]